MINKTALILCVVGLAACAEKPSVTATQAPSAPAMATIAQGIAMPAGYKVDAGRTLIFGTDEAWTGRLSYSTKTSADDVFEFLHKEMPSFGWAELSSMRSDASVLTFTSDATSRIATIHIGRGSMLGATEVDLVVAPKQAAKPPQSTARVK
jgi:hypothetical protein